MPRGASKRVVIEVDPDLKGKLYVALAEENSTLKDWFVDAATRYLAKREQPDLPLIKGSPKKERTADVGKIGRPGLSKANNTELE
jgi:hypothetical protein